MKPLFDNTATLYPNGYLFDYGDFRKIAPKIPRNIFCHEGSYLYRGKKMVIQRWYGEFSHGEYKDHSSIGLNFNGNQKIDFSFDDEVEDEIIDAATTEHIALLNRGPDIATISKWRASLRDSKGRALIWVSRPAEFAYPEKMLEANGIRILSITEYKRQENE